MIKFKEGSIDQIHMLVKEAFQNLSLIYALLKIELMLSARSRLKKALMPIREKL